MAGDLAQGAGSPEIDPALEGTVLHELIHWNRIQAGIDTEGRDEEGPSEAFELEAYGKRIWRTWKTCYEQPYFKTK